MALVHGVSRAGGEHTEVVCQALADAVFVIVTQVGDVSCIVDAEVERAGQDPIHSVRVVLGEYSPVAELVARRILESLSPPRMRLVLSFGLKDRFSTDQVKDLVDVILQHKNW
ncbi:Proteasome assembly chaperone 3 [Plasmodiophora brassicae]